MLKKILEICINHVTESINFRNKEKNINKCPKKS